MPTRKGILAVLGQPCRWNNSVKSLQPAMPNDCSECKQQKLLLHPIVFEPEARVEKMQQSFLSWKWIWERKKIGDDWFASFFFKKNLKLQKMKTKRSKESETNRSQFFPAMVKSFEIFKDWPLLSYFRLLLITIGRKLFNDALRGIEPRSSGNWSDRSTNWLA